MSNMGMDFMFAEILPRFSVKSLVRFRCVSKSFKTFISSPDFARLYYSLSSNTKDLRLVISGDLQITLYDLESTTDTATFHWRNIRSLYVIGSSNGLLCITTYSNSIKKIFILNPTTRIYKDIPMPDDSNVLGVCDRSFGFAFDPENLDFKIVVVFDTKSKHVTVTRITMVYSLNTGTWTKMETKLPGDIIAVTGGGDSLCRGIRVNNSLLLWEFWCPSSGESKIACFDVCKSKWTYDVLLPQFIDNPNFATNTLELGVFDGCLSLSYRNRAYKSCNVWDMWVMKEYGVQSSWVKLMTKIRVKQHYHPVPVAFRRGSTEVLIRGLCSPRLYWYNMNNGEIDKAKFDGAPYFRACHQVCMSSKSLVEIPGGKLMENSDNLWLQTRLNAKLLFHV